MPEIVWLELDPASPLCQQGFPPRCPAVAYDKSYNIFSESDHILWDFMPEGTDMKTLVEFNHDPECNIFPEVYAAWKNAGQEDNCPLVATCPTAGKWGVGFGGRVMAMRAAKLAMALSLAMDADPGKLAEVCNNYPAFAKFCAQGNVPGMEMFKDSKD